ncbi:KUP/HAK/KT family potassium transporter, partial [Bdellovibrionota bacterium FG-2]
MSDSTSTRKTPSLAKLSVGALGVVFGDIGTSPLYAIKECFSPSHGISLTSAHVLGVLSLIFWSLTLVVSIKYLIFILRADNRGEGGILALLALLIPKLQYGKGNSRSWLVLLGLFGAALLYGDGVITPAISVLSAIEGLQVATPRFQPIVVPLTIAILMGLFWFQKRGTHSIGNVFGPMMLVWFLTIAATGVPWILQHPEILQAISPHHAVMFLLDHEIHGFFVLSAVVLCITGGEALYADMGHFGRGPIQLGWFALAFPCLLVNYFGQGAYILAAGAQGTVNPFFGMVPSWGLYPMVIVSTIATVIASQALISGAYSLTQQAVQLGYLPRVVITHTSRSTEGQIFVPTVNVLLMLSCVSLVLVFQESSRLAAAYGIAVTGTMAITSLL